MALVEGEDSIACMMNVHVPLFQHVFVFCKSVTMHPAGGMLSVQVQSVFFTVNLVPSKQDWLVCTPDNLNSQPHDLRSGLYR